MNNDPAPKRHVLQALEGRPRFVSRTACSSNWPSKPKLDQRTSAPKNELRRAKWMIVVASLSRPRSFWRAPFSGPTTDRGECRVVEWAGSRRTCSLCSHRMTRVAGRGGGAAAGGHGLSRCRSEFFLPPPAIDGIKGDRRQNLRRLTPICSTTLHTSEPDRWV